MPLISIYIPTYNRAHLLHNSIGSVIQQQYDDWELIIVDDGSTDNTREVVCSLTSKIKQPVKYIFQENRGLFYSRNVGVENASGKYIAPLDSDDAWEPHHLAACVKAFEKNPEVDWVYAPLRRVDADTGHVVMASSFEPDGQQKRFLELNTRCSDALHIIEDDRLLTYSILYGINCSQQTSLIRKETIEKLRFTGRYRNCEDQQIAVRAVLADTRFAYFRDIHLTYYIHEDNISNVSWNQTNNDEISEEKLDKAVRVQHQMIQLFEELEPLIRGNRQAETALQIRLGHEYFWLLGYNILWRGGRYHEAMDAYRLGIRQRPCHLPFWKSYFSSIVKYYFLSSKNKSSV